MIQIFDGAMGTMLQAGGLAPGACPELMNVDHPEVVQRIHEAYIAAGSTVIETNTFGASSLKLAHYGIESRMAEINAAAVKIAKKAAGGRAKVAGSMGPTGRFVAPLGDLDFEDAYRIFYDQAKALAEAGSDYIIIETCIDIQEMRAALLATKDACNLPVICQLSYSEDGRTVTGTDPKSAAVILSAMGADIIGVNCSLGPEQLVPVVKILADSCDVPISVQPNAGMPYLEDGETKFPMDPENFGSWEKKLAAEIREGSLLSVKKEAVNQVKAGAHLLDVNMGVGGIDQVAAMKRAVTEISQITDAPLVIDTGDAKALEAGLRAYPGRALVNSVTWETQRRREFLPLAKKYGAAILCLPITDEGVPKTSTERVEVMGKILQFAKETGLRDGDFLLDALVMTVSADANACREVLDTLRGYGREFGYPTTMGLSNISFGLPNRPLINSTFFAMCLAAGLDAPIMNPYDESMQNALMASAALLGKDPNGLAFSKNEGNLRAPKKAAEAKERAGDILSAIKLAVIDGEKDGIEELVARAIEEGHDTNEITEKALTAAMTDIGVDFGAGRMFLPQVLLSAETMRGAFQKLKELLPAQESASKGTFVIATVKGDVHDLGKNITGALLANSGFKLIDLGKDVDSQEIVKAAMEHSADIVGLCALMTTTMVQIDKVIAELHEAGCKAKVMVGGAALTQEYAEAAGADAYAADGVKAVELAKKMVDGKK